MSRRSSGHEWKTYRASTASLRTERFVSSRAFASVRITDDLHGCSTSYRTMIGKRPRYRRAAIRTRCLRQKVSIYCRISSKTQTVVGISEGRQFFNIANTKVDACSDMNLFCADSASATDIRVSIISARISWSGSSRPRRSKEIN